MEMSVSEKIVFTARRYCEPPSGGNRLIEDVADVFPWTSQGTNTAGVKTGKVGGAAPTT